MPLKNHPIEREELMAFLDGELAADRASVTASHLESCQECQKLAADFQDLSQEFAGWQVEPSSPALANNIAAALRQPTARTSSSPSTRLRARNSER